MCWEGKGSLAGHVCVVTDVINNNCVKTAESGVAPLHSGQPLDIIIMEIGEQIVITRLEDSLLILIIRQHL